MKQLIKKTTVRSLITLSILSLIGTIAWGQDSGGSTEVTTTHTETQTWYAEPWVWILGGAILLILLVALLRGGSGSKVTVTKTTTTDTDAV